MKVLLVTGTLVLVAVSSVAPRQETAIAQALGSLDSIVDGNVERMIE